MVQVASLNLFKTHFILFRSKRNKTDNRISLKIDEQTVTQVKCTKFLGVFIDESLSSKEHINIVVNKLSKLTGIIRKARHFVAQSLLRSIYYALIYPYLFYGNVVWGNTYKTYLDEIFKLQKTLVRIMLFKEYNHESKPLFQQLNIFNSYQINKFVIGCLAYQFLQNQLPGTLTDIFKKNDQIHDHNTCLKCI